jgi:hypothetical protein
LAAILAALIETGGKMNSGMMWFDNDPKTTLNQKVTLAAEYYRSKYGRAPDTCLVNPGMLPEPEVHAGKIQIRAMKTVLPGHLWIGVDEKSPLGAD